MAVGKNMISWERMQGGVVLEEDDKDGVECALEYAIYQTNRGKRLRLCVLFIAYQEGWR